MQDLLSFYLLGCLMLLLVVILDVERYEDAVLNALAHLLDVRENFKIIFFLAILFYCLTSWVGFYSTIRFYLKNGKTK